MWRHSCTFKLQQSSLVFWRAFVPPTLKRFRHPCLWSPVMGVRRNFSREGQRRHFVYPLQLADDAMQMDVHKTLCPLVHHKEKAPCYGGSHKNAFIGSNSQAWKSERFFPEGGQPEPYQPTSTPPIGGHAVTKVQNSVPSPRRGFCGLDPQTKLQPPNWNMKH